MKRKERFKTEKKLVAWLRIWQATWTKELGKPDIFTWPMLGIEVQTYPNGLKVHASGYSKTITIF